MRINFLSALMGLLLTLTLAGCGQAREHTASAGVNIVTVVGAIHGQHRRSERYSLDVLRKAIREFQPDIVLVELPSDRFETASQNFIETGEVRESRADDFPELTDVVFPLRKEMGFTMVPVAAWSKSMADERRATLKLIENDPGRAKDWAEYQAAVADYSRQVSGQSDDPEFIHSAEYDAAVARRQETYEQLFGSDLGPGGWDQINAAHLALMSPVLDELKGQEKRVLVLFGAWHKYKILEMMETRSDISLVDASTLF